MPELTVHFQPQPEFYTTEGCHISEVINQEDHPDVSLATARVTPGVTTRWHTVEAREIYYILSGKGRAEVDGEVIDVSPGQAVSIPEGVPQRIANTGTEDLVFLCVCTPRFRQEGYREVDR
ncbi:cupin domain-containing protein [Neolewinella agarilytica]|uniref:cupin domain-containing protein n=1 Tax=Neolewinella agarilytica TaxID=478744 RepID=UPI002355D3AD|nr:cupin domain-containing protein [Neolewinella agarilytica]